MRAVLAVFVLVVSACGGSQDYRSPTAPPVPPPTLQPLPTQANYVGDAVLVSVVDGCPDASAEVGATIAGAPWAVEITGSSIVFVLGPDECGTGDCYIWRGTLQGLSFSVSNVNSTFHLSQNPACEFREDSFFGTFSQDLSSFEANQINIFGPPENESQYRWSWRVRRL